MNNVLTLSRSDLPRIAITLLSLIGLSACSGMVAKQALPQPAASLDEAMHSYEQVESRHQLLAAIDLLDTYAEQNPGDYASRARLANAYTLLGAGYAKTLDEKASAYEKAMKAAEQAMLTSSDYAQARRQGRSFSTAVETLDIRYIEAMEFWKTALFYSFREAEGVLDKLLRYPRLKQAVAVMEHIERLDREAIGGSNLMSQGIYYLALPEFAGGDRLKSAKYLAEAAAVSKRSILPRWGRAKYYAVAMKDYELYRSDLQWVVAQPLKDLIGFRPWNVLLQREARGMLEVGDWR